MEPDASPNGVFASRAEMDLYRGFWGADGLKKRITIEKAIPGKGKRAA